MPIYIQFRYQYQQRKEGLLPRTPENLFSPQKIRCHHPKCPKLLSNHCNSGGSVNKLTNLQEQNNQLNSIQSAPLNNSNNNHDDILSDNSEIQSLNNTLSATMDEKQKMLLLKIANNSIAAAAASTVASGVDNDYGNVSALLCSTIVNHINKCMLKKINICIVCSKLVSFIIAFLHFFFAYTTCSFHFFPSTQKSPNVNDPWSIF